jgi:uncharacterized membrane protein
MNTETDIATPDVAPLPIRPPARIRQVATDRPWVWLAAGWRDFMANPAIGLAYGGAFCLAGWLLALLLAEAGALWAVLPATAGFFLVGPLAAAGLYEASRLREAGQVPILADAVLALRRNGTQLAFMGVVLLILHLFWVRTAGLLFMLFFGVGGLPTLDRLPMALLASDNLLPFLVIGTGFGFLLAAGSFAISAVSIPMLVDREVSALEAVTVSIQAVLENWRPMALWAGLIVVFTGLALVPFFLGLVVVLPLIGHATWHAYRDIVAR